MNDPGGSLWRKWDLHFHTPQSHDYKNRGLMAADCRGNQGLCKNNFGF